MSSCLVCLLCLCGCQCVCLWFCCLPPLHALYISCTFHPKMQPKVLHTEEYNCFTTSHCEDQWGRERRGLIVVRKLQKVELNRTDERGMEQIPKACRSFLRLQNSDSDGIIMKFYFNWIIYLPGPGYPSAPMVMRELNVSMSFCLLLHLS